MPLTVIVVSLLATGALLTGGVLTVMLSVLAAPVCTTYVQTIGIAPTKGDAAVKV